MSIKIFDNKIARIGGKLIRPAFSGDRGRRILWWIRASVTCSLAIILAYQVRDDLEGVRFHLEYFWYLIAAILVAIAAVLGSVFVWGMMLPPHEKPPFKNLLAHYLLGLLYNYFLPGAIGGDIIRVGALRQNGNQLGNAINAVLMARLVSLWSLFFLALGTVLTLAVIPGLQIALPIALVVGCAMLIVIGATAFLFGAPLTFLVKRLPPQWQTWHDGLRQFRYQTKTLVHALLISFAIQLSAIIINTLVAQAFNMSITLRMLALTIPLVNLIIMLPISLGGFGVREGTYIYLLGKMGANIADALLLSLIVYALLAIVTAGGAALSRLWIPKSSSGNECVS